LSLKRLQSLYLAAGPWEPLTDIPVLHTIMELRPNKKNGFVCDKPTDRTFYLLQLFSHFEKKRRLNPTDPPKENIETVIAFLPT